MINVNIEWDVPRDVPRVMTDGSAAIKHGKLGSPLAMEVDSRGKSSKTVLFLIKLEGNILVGGLEH